MVEIRRGGGRRGEGGGGQEGEGEETDIKSNNPHLTGGEKTGSESIIKKMVVPLDGTLAVLIPSRSPLKGDILHKYPLYKWDIGLIFKGPPSQAYRHFPYESSYHKSWM